MTTQVVILRAVRSLAPHLARLKEATTAYFNRLSAPHQLAKLLDQVAGDGPRLTVADDSAVDLDDGNHLGGRAGEEALVGDVDVVPGEPHFAYRKAALLGQFNHRVARDPLQDAGIGGGRLQDTSPHEEDIVAGTLGHFALGVEHPGPRRSPP